jgi:hypothetical protein
MNSYLPFHRCMDKIICHIISFVRKWMELEIIRLNKISTC